MPTTVPLPAWAEEIIAKYKSDAYSQFVVHGNVSDKLVLPSGALGNLEDFFLEALLAPFDVVFTYDIGNGLRIVKGDKLIPTDDVKQPRVAVEAISEAFRYVIHRDALSMSRLRVACILRDAQLVVPNSGGSISNDLNATASVIRDWSRNSEFLRHNFTSFIVTENVSDLHPMLVSNDRAARINIPLPSADEIDQFLTLSQKSDYGSLFGTALQNYKGATKKLAEHLVGVSMAELESLLKQREFAKKPLEPGDIVTLKKQIIEKQGDGLIEFIDSKRSLDDIFGHEPAKKVIRSFLKKWDEGVTRLVPMGILFAAPVGVGKNFFVECVAGSAGIPVVLIKNFRDKWVGATESKQEKIIRLVRALGRCFVFFDEASGTLGKRYGGDGDSGLSARIYAVWANEMSNPRNRGKIVWLMADSRADMIEVDLKRPGRTDIMIPLFPAGTDEEAFHILSSLAKREGIEFPPELFKTLQAYGEDGRNLLPTWLTPGAAEAIAKKIVSEMDADALSVVDATIAVLRDYQPPIALSKLEEQIRIACEHCTGSDFIPDAFKRFRPQ